MKVVAKILDRETCCTTMGMQVHTMQIAINRVVWGDYIIRYCPWCGAKIKFVDEDYNWHPTEEDMNEGTSS